MLAELVTAARLMDEIFLRQVWVGNPEMRAQLADAQRAGLRGGARLLRGQLRPLGPARRDGAVRRQPAAPAGRRLLPGRHDKEEFEAWIAEHPEDEAAFTSLVTVIRRQDPDLVAVPYSSAYREWLEPAAAALRRAAAATGNESLRRFLTARADAFLSDDYYASDVAWMDLDSPVEVTIGPYETYEDGLFGYKAAFEAFVTVDLGRRVGAARAVQGTAALARAQPADPRGAQEPRPRQREPDPGRRRALCRRRRQGGRADPGLQPAQRRAGARGEGLEEGAAEKRPAGQVRPDPGADRRARPAARRRSSGSPSTPTWPRSCTTS